MASVLYMDNPKQYVVSLTPATTPGPSEALSKGPERPSIVKIIWALMTGAGEDILAHGFLVKPPISELLSQIADRGSQVLRFLKKPTPIYLPHTESPSQIADRISQTAICDPLLKIHHVLALESDEITLEGGGFRRVIDERAGHQRESVRGDRRAPK